MLCVHHPEPSVREEAVRQLGRALRHRNKVSCIFSTVWAEISRGCKFGNVATSAKDIFEGQGAQFSCKLLMFSAISEIFTHESYRIMWFMSTVLARQ